MPESIAIAAFVFGAVLFLIAIAGGNLKIFGSEISNSVSNPGLRAVSFFVGTFFLVISVASILDEPSVPSSSPPYNNNSSEQNSDFQSPTTSFSATSYCSMTDVYGYGEHSDVSTAQDLAIDDCIYAGGVPDCCASNVRVSQ